MAIDLTGLRFGRLVVIERNGSYVSPKGQAHRKWLCKCDCGNFTTVTASNLRSGETLSCGCLHRETFNNKKHNGRKTPLYNTWRAMKERCNNPNSIIYKWYGGKGIKVCDEWNDFEAFRDWAITSGYKEGLSIDRIDSNLGYFPENCRWLTRAENSRRAAKEMQRRKKCTKI